MKERTFKKSKITILLLTVSMIVAGVFGGFKGGSSKVDAAYATPRLIVTGCDIKGGSVKAGDDFDMTIHLKNESTSTKLTNIKFKISSEAGEIVTASGSDSFYIDEIEKEKEYDLEVKMKSRADLEQKTYTVNVNYSYENNSRETFEDTAALSVPVKQDIKLSLSEKKLTKKEVSLDGKTSLTFKINNTGLGDLRNVTVDLSGDTISDITYFVGAVKVGESGTVDTTITPENVGDQPISIKVTYEDNQGNSSTFEDEMELTVTDAEVDAKADEAAVETKNISAGMIGGGIVFVILIVIVVSSIIKKKNQKKYE